MSVRTDLAIESVDDRHGREQHHGTREEAPFKLFEEKEAATMTMMICTTDKNNPKLSSSVTVNRSDVQIGCRNDRRYSKLVRFTEETGGKILSSTRWRESFKCNRVEEKHPHFPVPDGLAVVQLFNFRHAVLYHGFRSSVYLTKITRR